MSEKLTPERAARLLRAKAAELENRVKQEMDLVRPVGGGEGVMRPVTELAADIALIASLLADHIERLNKVEEAYIAATNPGIDMDQVRRDADESDRLVAEAEAEYQASQERAFREGFDEGRP